MHRLDISPHHRIVFFLGQKELQRSIAYHGHAPQDIDMVHSCNRSLLLRQLLNWYIPVKRCSLLHGYLLLRYLVLRDYS